MSRQSQQIDFTRLPDLRVLGFLLVMSCSAQDEAPPAGSRSQAANDRLSAPPEQTVATGWQAEDDRIIEPGERVGLLTEQTSPESLVAALGAASLEDREVPLGDGLTEPSTVVFPSDSAQRLNVFWGREDGRLLPCRVELRGDTSLWRTSEGVTLGTTLKELEALNGRSFRLFGYGTEGFGTVQSWEGGNLGKRFGSWRSGNWMESQRMIVRLTPSKPDFGDSVYLSVVAESEFPSDHWGMQDLNPAVFHLIVNLGRC